MKVVFIRSIVYGKLDGAPALLVNPMSLHGKLRRNHSRKHAPPRRCDPIDSRIRAKNGVRACIQRLTEW